MVDALVFVWGDLHSDVVPVPVSVSPPSPPNRVPLPGQEGGGERGSGVNQGSWIYDGKPHCLPERPLTARRRPLGGMGPPPSFCAQVVCLRASHLLLMGRSHLPAPGLPSPRQLERGEPEFSAFDVRCHGEDV